MDGFQHSGYRYIQTQRILGLLGAEVSGVDLSRPVDEAVLAEIRFALLEHPVIFFAIRK